MNIIKKRKKFFLIGRTLDATEGRTGSLRQTAEEVITMFHDIILFFSVGFPVQVFTRTACKESCV